MQEFTTEGLKKRAEQIAKLLQSQNPKPKTELVHANEYQLAIAVVLSAQTTDKKVNQVTPKLFAKYTTWNELALANPVNVEKFIYGVNFHKGKAQRLIL